MLGTPAEEDGGGKMDLLREGAFDDMQVVFMAHPLQDDAPYLPLVAEHEYVLKEQFNAFKVLVARLTHSTVCSSLNTAMP